VYAENAPDYLVVMFGYDLLIRSFISHSKTNFGGYSVTKENRTRTERSESGFGLLRGNILAFN